MPGGLGQLLMGVPAVALCVFALVKMRGRRDPWVGMCRIGVMWGVLCFSVFVVWGLTRSLCLMPYLSKTVAAIRRAPVADVKAVDILPTSRAAAGFDLVGDEVRLEDKTTVRRIVGMLKSAKPWDPNHPVGKWVCLVALDFGERRSYCTVKSTTNQGTLITIHTGKVEGWVLAQYREDRLGDLLEQLAGQDKGPLPASSLPKATRETVTLVVHGKMQVVSLRLGAAPQDLRELHEVQRVLEALKSGVLEHRFKDARPLQPEEVERWCEYHRKFSGATEQQVKGFVQADKRLMRRLRRIMLSSASQPCRSVTRPSSGEKIPHLEELKRVYRDVRSVDARLQELDAKPPSVALWRRTAERMLRIRQLASEEFGKESLRVSQEEIRSEQIKQREIGLRPLSDELQLTLLQDGKATDLFHRYILGELRKGKGITIKDKAIRRKLLEYLAKEALEKIRRGAGH